MDCVKISVQVSNYTEIYSFLHLSLHNTMVQVIHRITVNMIRVSQTSVWSGPNGCQRRKREKEEGKRAKMEENERKQRKIYARGFFYPFAYANTTLLPPPNLFSSTFFRTLPHSDVHRRRRGNAPTWIHQHKHTDACTHTDAHDAPITFKPSFLFLFIIPFIHLEEKK